MGGKGDVADSAGASGSRTASLHASAQRVVELRALAEARVAELDVARVAAARKAAVADELKAVAALARAEAGEKSAWAFFCRFATEGVLF